MITIGKEFEFSASHQLVRNELSPEENFALFGKCAQLHGHNYLLQVAVCGTPQANTGMIMDFRDLKAIVKEVIVDEVDHRHLNTDVPWLSGILPTAELLVNTFFIKLSPIISSQIKGAELYQLTLWETRTSFAKITSFGGALR